MVISVVTCETVMRTMASEVYKFRVIAFFCMLYTNWPGVRELTQLSNQIVGWSGYTSISGMVSCTCTYFIYLLDNTRDNMPVASLLKLVT
jgi:hypothetical protein